MYIVPVFSSALFWLLMTLTKALLLEELSCNLWWNFLIFLTRTFGYVIIAESSFFFLILHYTLIFALFYPSTIKAKPECPQNELFHDGGSLLSHMLFHDPNNKSLIDILGQLFPSSTGLLFSHFIIFRSTSTSIHYMSISIKLYTLCFITFGIRKFFPYIVELLK